MNIEHPAGYSKMMKNDRLIATKYIHTHKHTSSYLQEHLGYGICRSLPYNIIHKKNNMLSMQAVRFSIIGMTE